MKIGISAFAGDGGKSGISQYMVHIFQRLPKLAPEDRFVLFMAKSDRSFFDIHMPQVIIHTYPDWIGHPIVNIFWHLVWLPLALKRERCDCVFMPAGNRRLAWWYGVPAVGVIHDMSQLHIPAKYDPLRMFYIKHVLPRMMRRLKRVIAISRSTRKDLIEYVGIEPERVHLIYNGADLERFTPKDPTAARANVRHKLGIDVSDAYILYIARLEHPGKNHVRLIKAFALLKQRYGIPHKLVLAGGRWSGAEAIDDAIADSGFAGDIILTGFVDNKALPDLYAGADVFVFPSLFEGFGIPALEAMASGVPVCVANRSSLPEVVGDAGLLFDPENVDEMAECIHRLITDQALRERLIAAGLQQVRKFSWDASAQGVLDQCRKAVNGE